MRAATLIIGSIVSSFVGGALGLMAGIRYVRGIDPILPVPQAIGLLAGMIVGPAAFAGIYSLLSRKDRQ